MLNGLGQTLGAVHLASAGLAMYGGATAISLYSRVNTRATRYFSQADSGKRGSLFLTGLYQGVNLFDNTLSRADRWLLKKLTP